MPFLERQRVVLVPVQEVAAAAVVVVGEGQKKTRERRRRREVGGEGRQRRQESQQKQEQRKRDTEKEQKWMEEWRQVEQLNRNRAEKGETSWMGLGIQTREDEKSMEVERKKPEGQMAAAKTRNGRRPRRNLGGKTDKARDRTRGE